MDRRGGNVNGVTLQQDFAVIDGFSDPTNVQDVVVRMSVPNRPMWHFIDDGEVVELYVTFADGVVGIPCTNGNNGDYKVDLAGQECCLKSLMSFETNHSTMFKATTEVSSTLGLQAGQPVPFSLQYRKDETGDRTYEISDVTEPNMPVYYQPVWKKLLNRDGELKQRIDDLDGKGVTLKNYNGQQPECSTTHHSDEGKPLLQRQYNRPETPKQLADDDFFLYYTRKACKPLFYSQNPFVKFVRELLVTPLTNFTGLSLYYQLYLVEIFHVNFLTKLGHYLCMPFIVLFMATWFAQWRLVGHYRTEDVGVFIVNGTLLFVCFLQVWYIIWGCLYRMPLFGVFMMWPLFFMYMFANMLFQIIVVNSFWIRQSHMTVANAERPWGQNSTHWYDAITLAHYGVKWYLNPLLWALIFAFLQAFSHVCEDKLPPRVTQTAHWLDMTTTLKQNGHVHFALIMISQTIFGTFNEFFASPRLLPLLLLRLCYSLGYQEKQWVKFHMLVLECLKFGDPAIDYIGRGGANWPREFNRWKPENLDENIKTIERGLSQEQKENLRDPAFLKNEGLFTKELQHYVLLRHRLTKYKVQVEAYGPFTPRETKPAGLEYNETMMMNDFPDNPAFRMFLEEARSHFAEMEYNFVEKCKLKRVFL